MRALRSDIPKRAPGGCNWRRSLFLSPGWVSGARFLAPITSTAGLSAMHHLRVQTCLTTDGHAAVAHGEVRTSLGISGRRFAAVLSVEGPLTPGGPAVHGNVTLLEPAEALQFLPPGTQFEIWDGARVGYGSVLGWL